MSLHGLDGYLVDVQVDVSSGMPAWEIVGLPDVSIKESKERVRTSIKNSGLEFPSRRIIVNLAPADSKKEGAFFDLPIAIGILTSTENIVCNNLNDYAFIGELSLNGKINKVNGVLPMCIEAQKLGIKKIVLPSQNLKEASVVKGLEIIPADFLIDVINHLNNFKLIPSPPPLSIDSLEATNSYKFDFSEVKGQENIKRALEIAAAGGHNALLIRKSSVLGKTMMARRLPGILPNLSFDESLEITKIHSIAGTLPSNTPLITSRPFRSPHNTISSVSLIGGGRIPKPGEISLAHHGVLFLDELPEFNKSTLELLRSPLEDRIVTISRVNATLTYPCNFMFVSSMNPCPCGYYGSKEKECTCTPKQISNYMSKISGPLLDRIDIHIEVTPVKYKNLEQNSKEETSETIRTRVNNARLLQQSRYKEHGIFSNSELTPTLIEKYCILDSKGKDILKAAFDKLGLSARAYGRILKVSRTIADLENSEAISPLHIAEAIQYRSLDKKYWSN
jgi:magnesium chelatase family protein